MDHPIDTRGRVCYSACCTSVVTGARKLDITADRPYYPAVQTTGTKRDTEKSESVRKASAALVPSGPIPSADATPASHLTPPVLAKGKGAKVTDVDGNEYIDYDCAGGSLLLGHADERVVVAINKAASKGYELGAPSQVQVRLAELLASRFSFIDMVSFVDSVPEAILGVMKLARACTGRQLILTSCPRAAVRQEILGALASQPDTATGTAHGLRCNDTDNFERFFAEHGSTAAALIVEPVSHASGLLAPAEGFLESLRLLCDKHGVLLVFDESITGFRVASGGAAMRYGVVPDLTVLGSLVGGGLPLAVFGARREIMRHILPEPGGRSPDTVGGNLLGMAAAIATLQACGEPDFYEALETRSARLVEGLAAAAADVGVPVRHERVASLVSLRFVRDTTEVSSSTGTCDTGLFASFYREMLDRGVLLPPSPRAPWAVSDAHTIEQIEQTVEAAHDALRAAAAECGR